MPEASTLIGQMLASEDAPFREDLVVALTGLSASADPVVFSAQTDAFVGRRAIPMWHNGSIGPTLPIVALEAADPSNAAKSVLSETSVGPVVHTLDIVI